MLAKLSRYSQYIQMSLKERQTYIRKATTDTTITTPIPGNNQTFSQQDFVHLTVFNQKKTEEMFKLKTYRQQSQSANPKAVVVLFHGLKSHTNRGVNLAKYFASRDIVTVGFDYRGFGQSQGSPGYISNFEAHISDSEKFVQEVREIYPKLPLFGVGLSLGGATAYHLSRKHPKMFQGSVLMAPALMPPPAMANHFGKILILLKVLGWIFPGNMKLSGISAADNCRNPNYLEYCSKDQYFQKDGVKLATMLAMKDFLDSRDTFSQYNSPFMVVQGGCDKIIDPQVAFDLYSMAKTPQQDKQIIFYEKMFHDIWHEPQIEEIQIAVADWIGSRVKVKM